MEGRKTRRPLEIAAVVQGRVTRAGKVAEKMEKWSCIRDRL